MHNTNKDIQIALYRLSKIVDNGGSHHILEARKENQLEIFENIPYYCKIHIRGQDPPLALHFTYKKEGDLEVYLGVKN